MAASALKQNWSRFIAPNLPPTTNAFYHQYQRVARQVNIWNQVYYPDIIIEQWNGYETVQNEIPLKWLTISYLPSNPRLPVCGKCSGICQRCSCGKSGLVCILLCKCSRTKCQNRNHVWKNYYYYTKTWSLSCFLILEFTIFSVESNPCEECWSQPKYHYK